MKFFVAIAVILSMTISTKTACADDNIVVVFDTSASMGEYMRSSKKTRMAVAQQALIKVLSKIPDTTKIGVITFKGWIYDLQKLDRAKLETAIVESSPYGSTPLYEYIIEGANKLLEERARQGNVGYYKLIVVTDGAADPRDAILNSDSKFADGSLKVGALKDIISRGIFVDAIGLAMQNNHPLSTQINGRYMRGDNSQSLEESLQQSVAEVGFDGKDGLISEAFKDIAELPDSFVVSSLRGLTELRNHPVGQQPVVQVVQDGKVVAVPIKNSVKPVVKANGGNGWMLLTMFGMGIAVVGFFGFIAANCSGNRNTSW